MDLRFVNVSDPRQSKSGASRQLVRSHAMRSFRHKQRLERENSPNLQRDKSALQGLASKGTITEPNDDSRRRVNSGPGDADEESEEVINATTQDFARDAMFPNIELFPVPFSQKFIFNIFHHYGGAIAGGLLPLGKFVASNPLRTKVLPLATRDSALFHIILATAGMDMIVWRGETFFDPLHRSSVRGLLRGTEFCMRHKLEGMRVIQARLKDPVLSISDETVLAVCHLASLERPEDRFKDVHVHIDGMEQMVKLRGGLKMIGMDSCVTHLVLRVDHLHSALTGRRPRFPVDDLFTEYSNNLSNEPLRAPSGLGSGVLNSALESIIHQLCNASEFIENIEDPVSEGDFFALGIRRSAIEDSLFKLGTSGGNDIQTSFTGIDLCCQLGAILYIQTVLTKVNCKVYRDLCTALRRKIEQITPEVLHKESSSLLLWLLLIGGGAAPYNNDRVWYIEQLIVYLQTNAWNEVKERLEGWPWRPKYCVIWKQVWRDAVKAKAGKVGTETV